MDRVVRLQVQMGMEVVGLDNQRVGEVKEVRGTDCRVTRPTQDDLYIPFDAVRDVDVSNNRIVLGIPAGQADAMGWTSESLGPGTPPPPSSVTES
jgi:hypothetical protein